MPKRELRPSTVLKMQQLKQKEQQEKQAQLTPTIQQPLQQPAPIRQEQSAPSQPEPMSMTQEEQFPMPQPEIREEVQQEEPAREEVQEQQPVATPEPLQLSPPVQENPLPPPKKQEEWHPQMPTPPREAPAVPNNPHMNVDMTRIEDLTRHIMYRDPQKSAFARGRR